MFLLTSFYNLFSINIFSRYLFIFFLKITTRDVFISLVWSDCEVIFFVVFISELCNMIVCLFPRLSSDTRFRMMDAILGLVIFNVLN